MSPENNLAETRRNPNQIASNTNLRFRIKVEAYTGLNKAQDLPSSVSLLPEALQKNCILVVSACQKIKRRVCACACAEPLRDCPGSA